AGEQTKGRGRRGRDWSSPADGNIYMSLGLKPEIQPDLAPMMTLIEALAVAQAVKEQCALDCKIKWPNDVVVSGKKICGILTEMSAETGYIHYVVIGTGINVNETTFSEEIRDTATSLRLETGEEVMRAPLIAKKCEYFEQYYKGFLKDGDLRGLQEDYNAMMVNRDRQVRVLDPKGEFSGIATGINEKGELLVKKEDGETVNVFAGEVSVRGVYGYV
ncbi:MAG: biotin--[acetyl-CoA-carboxylase] ligase, partial [Lachnospiraceae bacterium]|nr:biotin--[acetyl-CoA-carboxylase] ligase [Lachnospiraceae bacterium]